MSNLRINANVRNTMADDITTALDAGAGAATIKIYDGTQPTTPETAITSQVLLGTLTCTDPAGAAASGGVLTFSTITEDSAADATGTATWARVADSNGVAVFDCDVGTTGTTIVLNSTSIVTGGPIRITSFTITIPA